MSDSSKREEAFSEIKSTAIDGLFDLRAMALAGAAMSFDSGDEKVLNLGRVMNQIANCAAGLIREIDVVLPKIEV
ncbi:MAG: hypothetical protein A3K04_11160 [Gallionellales bacterium RBG_16_56_9]|nr:MAG: hypothetical protein A3K04_11160 [Gallionellales bacterium RBG_16_56_9]